ncbi:MAG: endolytic transglycosylase MltG, partial [Proteobacteria bacterium]|nr:endolytic transglycosylase MltG [Pseudomonadota bacterium]
ITKGEKLDRSLTKTDLNIESPYNTYRIKGLPKGAIGCPGKASIQAVLNPSETKALYFVANGKGGHEFSDSLDEHNTNVKQWRLHQKKIRNADQPENLNADVPVLSTLSNEVSPLKDQKNIINPVYKPSKKKKIKAKNLSHYRIKKKKSR